jgi:hypothetical protein
MNYETHELSQRLRIFVGSTLAQWATSEIFMFSILVLFSLYTFDMRLF